MISTTSKTVLYSIPIAAVITLSSIAIYSIIRLDKNRDKDNNKQRAKRSLGRIKYNANSVASDPDYIIVGSGMGGLSCAAVLSRLGYKTLVLEQHPDVCGGGTHSFDLKGYRFDSGLHYTVPWSVPVFALTCGKKPKDVCQFEIMGEDDGTVDKVYLVKPNEKNVVRFNMKYKEKHIVDLYKMFPNGIHYNNIITYSH